MVSIFVMMMSDRFKHYYNRLTPIDIIVSAYCAIMLFLVSLRIRQGGWTAVVLMLNYSAVFVAATVVAPMMDRIQHGRKKSIGKGKVAVNSRADKHLPA